MNNDKKIKFLINNFGWESEKTVLVLFSYRSRIVLVSIPYQSRIDPVSFSYRSPIVLASGSGNNTETIRKQYEVDICWKGGRYVVGTWSAP